MLLFLLLRNLLFRGVPFSYDAMTYSRSLWGVAHGDFFNPVVSAATFGIHGQFVLFLMAPFAMLMPPAIVLALAQAAAFGTLVWMVTGEAADAVRQAGHGLTAVLAAVGGGALLVIACAPVMNPFLFDVRPDVLAVPILAAGALRCVRLGGPDRASLALLLGSVLVREEFAFVAAATLLAAPAAETTGLVSRRARILAALSALAYFALYVLVIRRALGGQGLVSSYAQIGSNLLNPGADSVQRFSLPTLLRYKAEILIVAACSFGGLALAGGRWLWAAAPGAVLLLTMSRLQPWVLNTHYSMFAAPGLVASAVAGFRRWAAAGFPRSRAVLPVVAAMALTGFFAGSALPGGGHYLPRHYWLNRKDPRQARAADRLALCRAALARIPSTDGLAVPFVLGPPVAGRPVIVAVEAIPLELLRQGRVPIGVDWVALFPSSWQGYGRLLVERGGFHRAAMVPHGMVVLTDRPGVVIVESR
jgi:uncharacterized membrane protein